MTIFAGIISSDPSKLNAYKNYLGNSFNIETNSTENNTCVAQHHVFFGFEADKSKIIKSVCEPDGSFCWISGKAILDDSKESQSLEQDTVLKYHLSTATSSILRQSRGVYSGCVYDGKNFKLSLFTDKLGIRPIYIYQHEEVIIYSSVLSVIKALPFVDLTLDETNTTVFMALGFCLGNTTPYKYIQRLEAGEMCNVDFKLGRISVNSEKYWSYTEDVATVNTCSENDMKELFEIFKTSVFLRSTDAPTAVSFLSGGMDSRAITAMVNNFYSKQITFNYSNDNSQDQAYARKYAKNANLVHHEQSFQHLANPNWSLLIADSIKKYSVTTDADSKRLCNVAWSGDGGSVGLGMVYITKKIEKSLLTNDYDTAIHYLIEKFGSQLPLSFMKQSFSVKHKKTVFNEIKKNIFTCDEPIKSIYFFLLYNDQKRHMDLHFETICQHGIELELPFFDSDFLAKICSLPTNELIYHRAYSRWFELFPEYVRQTPWQTYPEHIPCPIASDDNFSYQWSRTTKPWAQKFAEAKKVLTFSGSSFVYDYFDKKKLKAAAIIHLLNIRDYSYLMIKANKLDSLKK